MIRVAAALLLFSAALHASAGKDGFQFLGDAGGPRAAALGGAGASLAGDVDGSFLNPGLLAVARSREAALFHAARPQGVSEGAASYVHPLSSGALGARVFSRSYGDIAGYDGAGGAAASYGARDTVFSFAYGRRFGGVGAGLSLKQARETIAGRSASAVALDAGLFAPWRGTPLTGSLVLRNAGGKAAFGGEKTSLPRSVGAGGALRLFSGAATLSVEGVRSAEGWLYRGGVEAWAYNVLSLRAGADGDGALTLGLGMRLKAVRVDYAFSPLGDALGAVHRMGLSFRFGGGAEAAYQRGVALAQKGNHAEAVLQFKEALDADPGHREAARALRESIRDLGAQRSSP